MNRALDDSNAERTFQLLCQLRDATDTSDSGQLVLLEMAAALYHEEMSHFRSATEADLNFEMICGAVRTLTQVAQVTRAVDGRKVTELLFALEEPLLSFEGVNSSLTESYMAALSEFRLGKFQRSEFCTVLTHTEIQSCITQVNVLFIYWVLKL